MRLEERKANEVMSCRRLKIGLREDGGVLNWLGDECSQNLEAGQ